MRGAVGGVVKVMVLDANEIGPVEEGFIGLVKMRMEAGLVRERRIMCKDDSCCESNGEASRVKTEGLRR